MLSLNELLTRYSTWVVAIFTGAVAYWMQLSPEEQAALKTAYPWLTKVAPAVGFFAFLIARAKKQAPPPFADTVPMERPPGQVVIRNLAMAALALALVACASVNYRAQIDLAYSMVGSYVQATQTALARGRITPEQAARAADSADEALSKIGLARSVLAGCAPTAACPGFESLMAGLQPSLLELEKELRAREAKEGKQ